MATDSHLTDLVGHWLMHSSHPTIEVRCIPGGGGGGGECENAVPKGQGGMVAVLGTTVDMIEKI